MQERKELVKQAFSKPGSPAARSGHVKEVTYFVPAEWLRQWRRGEVSKQQSSVVKSAAATKAAAAAVVDLSSATEGDGQSTREGVDVTTQPTTTSATTTTTSGVMGEADGDNATRRGQGGSGAAIKHLFAEQMRNKPFLCHHKPPGLPPSHIHLYKRISSHAFKYVALGRGGCRLWGVWSAGGCGSHHLCGVVISCSTIISSGITVDHPLSSDNYYCNACVSAHKKATESEYVRRGGSALDGAAS